MSIIKIINSEERNRRQQGNIGKAFHIGKIHIIIKMFTQLNNLQIHCNLNLTTKNTLPRTRKKKS